MSSDNEQNIASPKTALDQLKDWKELIAFIATGLTSVLGIFLSGGAVQIASTALAALVVAGGAWQVQRTRKRRKLRVERERIWEERRKQPRAAFRSLSPFEEQDELPGQDRKQQARSIAVRIVNDDFRFGIVCGDSGAGKTSLLRAEVMRYIRENGLEPVYLRNPRRLPGTALANASICERLEAELDTFEQECIPAEACVLILDQFEEWFIAYREPEARALLGRFIARLTERVPPVKVVCAVRREFLMDFHDLSPELPDPTHPNNTFRIRNFTVDQAIDAVQQCAAADGIIAEKSFAIILANDLEDKGEVRPPELQIVCTHLAESGGLSNDRYQAEGGTAGIIAHYIKNALESCLDPELGAKLLRSLCDFPTRTKRMSKTLDELNADTGGTTGSRTIAALVRTFVLARLLTEEKSTGSPDTYGLMHDYLVGAVELATGDVSTKTEEANQLLHYYLAQQSGIIPLRRLRFIRAHADRPLLTQPNARRLFRKSLITPALVSGVMVFVAVLMAGGLYLATTAQIQWQEKVIGRHWQENEYGKTNYKIIPQKEQVISDSGHTSKYIRAWNVQDGKIIASQEKPEDLAISINSNGEVILLADDGTNSTGEKIWMKHRSSEQNNRLIRIDSGTEIEFPANIKCYLSKSEHYIDCISRPVDKKNNTVDISLWSIDKKQIVHNINGIKYFDYFDNDLWIKPFQFSSDGERLVVISQEGEQNIVELYNAISGKKIKSLARSGSGYLFFDMHSMTKKICTILKKTTGDLLIQLWHLDTGIFIREIKIPTLNTYKNTISIHYSLDGQYILFYYFSKKEKRTQLLIFKATNFNLVQDVKQGEVRIENEDEIYLDPIAYWIDGNNLKIWQINKSTPISLQNVKLGSKDNLSSSIDMQRAIINGPHRPVELWDLKEKKRIRLLAPTKEKYIQSVGFTMNDTAVVIEEEGGITSLFDAKDGSPLAQHIPAAEVYYFDPDLRRIHVWNDSGQVIRYVEGRSYFGYFVPTKKGAWD